MKSILFLFTFILSFNIMALDVPRLTRPVEDFAGILSNEEKESLETKIRELHNKNIVQISVLIIPSLESEILEEFSIKVAESWKLGTSKDDNGLLLLLAMKERKIRIEVGNGIEGVVTDSASRKMISDMGYSMRNEDFKDAIESVVLTVENLFYKNTPEYKESVRLENEKHKEAVKFLFFIVTSMALGVSFVFFTAKFFSYNQDIKKLESDNKKLETYSVKSEQDIRELKKKLTSMNVDSSKQNQLNIIQYTKELKSKRDSLQNKVSQMQRMIK